MAWCRDFICQIAEGCDHEMQADTDSCHCEACGVVCKGRFEACPSIWARGPQPVTLTVAPPEDPLEIRLFGPRVVDGHAPPPAPVGNGSDSVVKATAKSDPPAVVGDRTEAPPGLSSASGAEVFRWFQTAFDALRQEVQGLRTALTQEQAMVAKLLDERREATLDVDAVTSALRVAVRTHTDDLRTEIAATVASLRRDLDAVRQAQDEHTAGLQSSVTKAIAASEGVSADLSRREVANRKALRVAVHEEFMPLVEVVAESVAQTEHGLDALGAKLEKLTELEASTSSTLDDIAEVVAELVALELHEEVVVEPPPVPPRPIDRVIGGGRGPAATKPPKSAATDPPPGNRVSLRRQPSER